MRRGEGRLIPRRKIKIQGKNKNRDRGIRYQITGRREISERKPRCGDRAERCFLRQSKQETEHVRLDERSQLPRTTYKRWWWVERTESDRRLMCCVCTIERSAMSWVCTRPAATDTQPPPRLATLCTAAVSAVARMVGTKKQGGVGLAVMNSITCAARLPDFIAKLYRNSRGLLSRYPQRQRITTADLR